MDVAVRPQATDAGEFVNIRLSAIQRPNQMHERHLVLAADHAIRQRRVSKKVRGVDGGVEAIEADMRRRMYPTNQFGKPHPEAQRCVHGH